MASLEARKSVDPKEPIQIGAARKKKEGKKEKKKENQAEEAVGRY